MLRNVFETYPNDHSYFHANVFCRQNSESNFETTSPDFFFKIFFVCFNLIEAVFSTNAREMRVTFLSFDLLLDFVLKTDLIRSEQPTNVSKISCENILFFAGSHG